MDIIIEISYDIPKYDEDFYDDSNEIQIHGNDLFQRVLEIDKSLSSFIDEIRGTKPRYPNYHTIRKLISKVKNGDLDAKRRIFEIYLQTILEIALKCYKKFSTPLAEAIQDGYLGLAIA